MSTFLYLGNYSESGMAGLMAEGGSRRERETRAFFESMGGRVLHYGFTTGDFDFVVVAEVPDDTTGCVPPLIVGSTGTVRVRSFPIMSAGQMDDVCEAARNAAFRAAGG